MQSPIESIRAAAEKLPNTTFVNVNHSALPHLEQPNQRYLDRFTSSLHSARQVPNIWYASQDDVAVSVGIAAGITRCCHLPLPARVLTPRPPREPNTPANIVIAGRADAIKNNLVHLIACGMLRDSTRLILCLNPDRMFRNTLHALRLDADVRGLLPHDQWIDLLRDEADLVLCCSHAESYCFIAVEAMQIGVPVVSSSAVRFTPPDQVAPGGTPSAIAETVEYVLSHYPQCVANGIESASTSAKQQRSHYVSQIADLPNVAQ